MATRSSREFMWRKAHASILAVEKDIRLLASGRIVNMPRLGEVTAQQELEAIVRGDRPVVPPEMEQAAAAGAPPRDFDDHPYLRRMEYRGGGYAILLALHERARLHSGRRPFMFKAELIREAQRFCDVSMLSSDGWGRCASCGWASHRSLLAHRLIVACRGASGAPGREEFRLTEDGLKLVAAVLRKWPGDAGGAGEVPGIADEAVGAAPAAPQAQQEAGLSRSRSRSLRRTAGQAVPPLPCRRRGGRPASQLDLRHALVLQQQRSGVVCAAGPEGVAAAPVVVEVTISDDEDGVRAADNAAPPWRELAPADSVVRILVDDRERLRNAEPRGLMDCVAAAVDGTHVLVSRCRLRFGDFMWVAGPAEVGHEDCRVLGCVVERKRVADLVGRSATGAHARQLERLETSGLPHAFLLIEGDAGRAGRLPVYDEGAPGEPPAPDVVRDEEDIAELCARLLVRRSPVGVAFSRDAQATARLLGQLSLWLAWGLQGAGDGPAAAAAQTLSAFQSAAASRAAERDDLASALRAEGVSAAAAEVVRRRFGSAAEARAAVSGCARPADRLLYFDFAPACHAAAAHVCAALGVQAPVEPAAPAPAPRSVHVVASPGVAGLLGVGLPDWVSLQGIRWERTEAEGRRYLRAVVVACAAGAVEDEEARPRRRLSAPLLVALLPGALLVRELLAVAEQLGAAASEAAVAEGAALSLALQLHADVGDAEMDGPRLVVLEGLRAAVRAEARSPCPRTVLPLPRLLAVAELSALCLDLVCGWRVRVHDVKPAETTSHFLRLLLRVAREEVALPL